MSVMLNAGMPLVSALEASNRASFKGWQRVVAHSIKEVRRGNTLSEALRAFESKLGPLIIALLEAGERMGNLDEMMETAAKTVEERVQLTHDIKQQLAYPAFIVILGLLLGPLPTAVAGEGYSTYWRELTGPLSAIALVLALGIGSKWLHSRPSVRPLIDGLIVAIPVVGKVIQGNAVIRICHTLAATIAAGFPLDDAVTLAAKAAGNEKIKTLLMKVYADNRNTPSVVSASLAALPLIPPYAVNMCQTGETTGELDNMLRQVAKVLADAHRNRTQLSVRILGALALLTVGGWVAWRVVSFYSNLYGVVLGV